LDLDANEDKVIGSEAGTRATGVDTVTVRLATVFDNESNNLTSEIDVLTGVFDVFQNGGAWIGERSGRSGASSVESKVKRKLEFATHGGNTTDDVSAINGAAIPCVGGDHGGFDPDKMGAAVGTGDGDGFVKVAEEPFDADSFVVATRGGVETNAKEFTSGGEYATKGTTSVDDNKTTHTNFQQDFLEQKASKFMSMDVMDRYADNKLSEVAHRG
jgi:hypothetical protein